MTTPKAKFAGLALIAALCAGFILGLTVPASAGYDAGEAAYKRGDYATALRELRPLAEQGNAGTQRVLGVMYGKGRGIPQDYVQAHMWYNLAASSYYPSEYRDEAVKNRDIVAMRMTPAQISEAQKLAREWKPKK
ncbi:MAG: sel1 repeat family protein [Gemmatimonadetes bacterium]|nr:sel1 repeat family protein [Gemmatimonadota bacterium]